MSAETPRLLVVEDDLGAVQGLIAGLTRAGFDVSVAMDGDDAVATAISQEFDLIVLDLMLPGRSGFEVLEALRGRDSTPIIVLSARTELPARLQSFELGAVDYVAKPFFLEELVARIRMRLALREDGPRRTVTMGDIEVDLDARIARREGEDLGLTAHEFNILAWLIERPGRAVTREQLVEHALGIEGGARADRTVDSHVSRVRKKLGEQGATIKTAWGVGYRYEPEAA